MGPGCRTHDHVGWEYVQTILGEEHKEEQRGRGDGSVGWGRRPYRALGQCPPANGQRSGRRTGRRDGRYRGRCRRRRQPGPSCLSPISLAYRFLVLVIGQVHPAFPVHPSAPRRGQRDTPDRSDGKRQQRSCREPCDGSIKVSNMACHRAFLQVRHPISPCSPSSLQRFI